MNNTILLQLKKESIEILERYGYLDTLKLNGTYITKKQYKEVLRDLSYARREEDADKYFYDC